MLEENSFSKVEKFLSNIDTPIILTGDVSLGIGLDSPANSTLVISN